MSNSLSQHDPLRGNRHYLLIAAAIVLATIAVWAFYLAPRQRRIAIADESLKKLEAQLLSQSWPRQTNVLQRQYQEVETLLNGSADNPTGLVGVAESTLAYATCTFREQIQERYKNNVHFMTSVTRLDCKDIYDRVSSQLQEKGLTLPEENFTADENSRTPIYQQILKLWTVQRLVELASANGLTLIPGGLTALQPIGYTLAKTSGAMPYLLELPVKFTVTGTLEQFLTFAGELQNNRQFLPMKQLVISTLPPHSLPPGEKVAVQELRCTVVCSSFFMPE